MQNIECKNKKYTVVLDRTVVIYTWVFLCYRILTTLTPFAELFKQPVFSVVPKLLGLAGAVLLAGDVFTERKVFRSANVRWILLLLLAICVSTAVRYPYNSVVDFAKYFAYVSVQDLLMYSAGLRMSRTEQKRFLKTLHAFASVIMIPALLYMFYQFAALQHYVTYEGVDQGWHEGRLFGITASLYGGAIVVSLLAFGTAYLFLYSKRVLYKCLYAAEWILCVIYLALSDCRTAFAACAAGLLLMVLYGYFRGRPAHWSSRRLLFLRAGKYALAYMLVLILMYTGITGIRSAGAAVIRHQEASAQEAAVQELTAQEAADPDETESPMSRPEGASFSSRRLNIWQSYFEILTDRPDHLIFGLSYTGYEKYIRERYPESYIVGPFKEMYPYNYQKGEVYQTHNSYLMVLVVSGIPGLIAVIGFLIGGIGYVFKSMVSGKMTSFECLLAALIAVVLTAGLFETTTIIPVCAVAGFFWMAAGMLMNSKETSV